MLYLYIAAGFMYQTVNSFTTEQYFHRERYTFKPAQKYSILNEAGNSNGDYRKDVDSMRKILESSWKEETMGSVPTNPQSAALNAAESVLSAMSDDPMRGIFMIDISLPSLDPMSGENVYDDVGATEFCIEFAERLNENRNGCERLNNKSGVAIVVKDDALISRAERFISKNKEESSQPSIEFFDDFADFAGSSSIQSDEIMDLSQENNPLPDKIRLRSILGSNEIETGSNMINDVVRSVSKNGSLKKDEDIIVILAPMSQQELVGVRWLVSKYGSSKTIIIFNNKLNPLPNELMMAEICYSVFPLIARSASPPSTPNDGAPQPVSPKIVLLRRFPRDWEIHIDINEGSGFELAASIPAVDVGMRGPSMDWIAGCVKQHMQLKLGQ